MRRLGLRAEAATLEDWCRVCRTPQIPQPVGAIGGPVEFDRRPVDIPRGLLVQAEAVVVDGVHALHRDAIHVEKAAPQSVCTSARRMGPYPSISSMAVFRLRQSARRYKDDRGCSDEAEGSAREAVSWGRHQHAWVVAAGKVEGQLADRWVRDYGGVLSGRRRA